MAEVTCRKKQLEDRSVRGSNDSGYKTSYKRNYGPEQLRDLSDMIDVYHRAFLISEGDSKAESLRLMRGYTTEFLSLVSHFHKFKMAETERVLSQSVGMIPEFDPREASLAFEDMAKFAHNLLEQPWRREFQRLKTLSGFFIHNIRTQLQNPQEILIVMGYVGTDDHTMVLARPPDPTVLTAISRDLYVASQECLILSQIWERVLGELPDCGLTLREVYEARKALMGDTTTIVKYLIHQEHQREQELREETIRRRTRHHQHFESQQYSDAHAEKHGYLTDKRLLDVTDGCASYALQNMNLKDSSKPNGYNKKPYSINNPNQNLAMEVSTSSSRNGSTSTSSPRSPSSCNSLKELHDVYYQEYIDQHMDGDRDLHRSSSTEINELLENHKKRVSQVDALKPDSRTPTQQTRGRKVEHGSSHTSVPIYQSSPVESTFQGSRKELSASILEGRSSVSSSSAFKGLKHHQDLPKSTGSNSSLVNNSGIFDKIKGTLGKTSKHDEKQKVEGAFDKETSRPKKPFALTKSKVSNPNDFMEKVETKGTGFLDKVGKPIVPNQSSIPREEFLQIDQESEEERISPIPDKKFDSKSNFSNSSTGTGTAIGESSQNALRFKAWACPHCTYVNEIAANVCEICSKSKDFVLEV